MNIKNAVRSLAVYLVSTLGLCAQTIDMNDFQGIIGATYRFSGTNQGNSGVLEYRFFDAPSLGSGGMHVAVTFDATDPANDYSLDMYAVDLAIQRVEAQNPSTSYTMYYNPAWSLLPRFVKTGGTYNSTGNYTYSVNGLFVTGSTDADIHIIGVENVTTPIGTFEAIKVTADMLVTDTWNSGWLQMSQFQTNWYVRGVGMVKQIITTNYSTSSGQQWSTTTNISLSYANVTLPDQPVITSTTWGKFTKENGNYVDTGDWLGMIEVSNAPWVYCFEDGEYIYVPEGSANSGKGWIYTP